MITHLIERDLVVAVAILKRRDTLDMNIPFSH
jgi:hypothetical protein